MRVVHARKKVFITDCAFENKFVLLTWVLSILKWKQYNNQVVLYTDNVTLEKIQKIGFDFLYDEINTDLFENGDQCKGIDFRWFWAMPKILALHYETYHLKNKVIVADMDIVPMSDLSRFWANSPVCVWSNKEHLEFKNTYPDIKDLSLPEGYTLPKWFTGEIKPLNTGVLYFKNIDVANEYCNEVFKYVKGNNNAKENTDCITMCNAEQRMLAEFLNHKGLTYQTLQPINGSLFNKNAFHTHNYKGMINNYNGTLWNLNFLLMIRNLNPYMFNILLSKELFKEEREYFAKNGYTCEKLKELSVYEK